MRRILFLLLLVLPVAAWAASVEELKSLLQQTNTAKARFAQMVLDKNMKKLQQATGTMQFARPGKFRWEYDKPYEQVIVSDGTRVWLYDKDLNQVTVRKYDRALGTSPAALLAGSNEIESFYNLDAKGTKGGLDWLEAFPKSEDTMFQKGRMGFKGNTLDTMELYDHLGQVTVIRFSRIQRNPKLAQDAFVFTPPKGADVLDDQ